MTPRVRPRVQAAWNGVVFLAPAHREVLPRLCSEAAWHRCFAKYAEVGEDAEGMRDEWGLKKENKRKGNTSNSSKCVSSPSLVASLLLALGKVSIHFPGLWVWHVLGNPLSSRARERAEES